MQPTQPPAGFPVIVLVGYFVLWLALALFIAALAPRKGRSRWVALIAFVPIVNAFYVLWLASLTDRSVLDRLQALETKSS